MLNISSKQKTDSTKMHNVFLRSIYNEIKLSFSKTKVIHTGLF